MSKELGIQISHKLLSWLKHSKETGVILSQKKCRRLFVLKLDRAWRYVYTNYDTDDIACRQSA